MDFRSVAQETTRGCIVLERPELLQQVVEKHSAKDSTARGTALAEIKSMVPRTSQYHPGHEIPERNLYYRIAKKFLFNDFGVYKGHDHTQTAAPYLVNENQTADAPTVAADASTPGCCGSESESTACCTEPNVVTLETGESSATDYAYGMPISGRISSQVAVVSSGTPARFSRIPYFAIVPT